VVFERSEIGFHGGEGLPQLVVQLMRKPVRRGFLGLQHVKRDPPQFGDLPIPCGESTRLPSGRYHREQQGQNQAGGGEYERAGERARGTLVDFGLRQPRLAVFRFDQPRYHRDESLMIAEQIRPKRTSLDSRP